MPMQEEHAPRASEQLKGVSREKTDARPNEAFAEGSVELYESPEARARFAGADAQVGAKAPLVLAFDTANEVVAIGVGELLSAEKRVRIVETLQIEAHRASNTRLLPEIDALFQRAGLSRSQIACVAVGRGPGSFTGVRIAMATAKGVAQALGVGLVGLSTLDAIAWNAQAAGVRGDVLVVADAMRHEVYPVRYKLTDAAAARQEPDSVVKAASLFAGEEASGAGASDGVASGIVAEPLPDLPAAEPSLQMLGDGLVKYADDFAPYAKALPKDLWAVSGRGLLLAFEAAWRSGEADPFDAARHNPAFVLPVYTRLSDAEENERARLSKHDPKNLVTGVQDIESDQVVYRPLDAAHVACAVALDAQVMAGAAWTEQMIAAELSDKSYLWWAAFANCNDEAAGAEAAAAADATGTAKLVGYAGGLLAGDTLEILRIGVNPEYRRRGIARELLSRVAGDARDLGAKSCMLEVRADNAGAQALYRAVGLAEVGVRPRYYDNATDAVMMEGPLPIAPHDVGGMELQVHDETEATPATVKRPLIIAIESSCDETAAAIVDGDGNLVADVVASQIDFHARFGGVVPEIASRKHIEAVCGLCDECFDVAAAHLGLPKLTWADLDAVSATVAPGLVGALVVGVAFAKGAAWGADKPFIGVNHLEGHLYANKIGAPDLQPPLVASLVSGGNTMLVHVKDWQDYETLGTTIDDAVGEAFDKVSKALGLGYPGGPIISKYAAKGNPAAIAFPRAMMHSHDLRFSLSGLKTAVVTYINAERAAGRPLNIPDIAASFQQAVVDVQVAKARQALEMTDAPTFCLGGGVAANPALREAYEKMCFQQGVRLIMPPLRSCGDNAGMIALVALDRYRAGKFYGLDADAFARADLDKPY